MDEQSDIENALIQKYQLQRPLNKTSNNRCFITQYSEDLNEYLTRFLDIKVNDWSPGQGWACLHMPVDVDDIIDITNTDIIGKRYILSFTEKSLSYTCLKILECKLPKLRIQGQTLPNVWAGQLWKIQIIDNKMLIGYSSKNFNKNKLCTVLHNKS